MQTFLNATLQFILTILISYSTQSFRALYLTHTCCFSFAIPSHSSKTGELIAISCRGQVSERWMDQPALYVDAFSNNGRFTAPETACNTGRCILHDYPPTKWRYIYTPTSFEVLYFSQSTNEIFLIRVMDGREENRNTSFFLLIFKSAIM